MKLLLHWFFAALAVFVAAYILPGIIVKSFFVALVVAVVLGLLNIFIKPLLVILTLPLEILTFGLFTFVINALLVMLTALIVPGFMVKNFWWALLFSLIISVVTWFFHRIENEGRKI